MAPQHPMFPSEFVDLVLQTEKIEGKDFPRKLLCMMAGDKVSENPISKWDR